MNYRILEEYYGILRKYRPRILRDIVENIKFIAIKKWKNYEKFLYSNVIRYGLVARIPGSHPGGSGSIPGTGKFFFISIFSKIALNHISIETNV